MTTTDNDKFYFLLLAAGVVLKEKETVCASDIQKKMVEDENFKITLPLLECRLALTLLESVGFIARTAEDGKFERAK